MLRTMCRCQGFVRIGWNGVLFLEHDKACPRHEQQEDETDDGADQDLQHVSGVRPCTHTGS